MAVEPLSLSLSVSLYSSSIAYITWDFLSLSVQEPKPRTSSLRRRLCRKSSIEEMEKEGKNQSASTTPEPDFPLRWGNRKRLRCFKTKDDDVSEKPDMLARKKTTSRIDFYGVEGGDKEALSLQPNHLNRNGELPTTHGSSSSENLKPQVLSPEKEDRYYATRASGFGFDDGAGKILTEGFDEKAFVWPKFFISLSCKEKEEDFLAMKGCKLPQRPKKRSKLIQKSIHLVCPGTWLSELSHERYEVREKKSSKKRPRGLKAMGNVDSESE